MFIRCNVGNLGDEMRKLIKLCDLAFGQTFITHLEFKVSDDGNKLALPHRSPTPLIVPCTWMAPSRIAVSELITAHSESL